MHQGRVKQIVGASLTRELKTNFVAEQPIEWYVELYQEHNLGHGHVIQLGAGNQQLARRALKAWPSSFRLGGGVDLKNAESWLNAGAEAVILTSYLFEAGRFQPERLVEMAEALGPENLVLDLSCKLVDQEYWVMADGWQTQTDLCLTADTLHNLNQYCHEFLVHSVVVEGRQQGVDKGLLALLGQASAPLTYAGGVFSFECIETIFRLGKGQVNFTLGSGLDIFGGALVFKKVVAHTQQFPTHPLINGNGPTNQ